MLNSNEDIMTYLNYINGEWVRNLNGEVIPSINLLNKNEIVGYVPDSSTENLNNPVLSAKKAQTFYYLRVL